MKYNKGFAPLILVTIIVGALVIGGGAYYLGTKKNVPNKEVEKEDVEILNTKENKINKGEIEIENKNDNKYLTYKDLQNGFQFDYLKSRFWDSADYSSSNPNEEPFYVNQKGVYIEDCAGEDPNCITTSLLFAVYVKDNITNEKDLKSYLEYEIKYQDMSDGCGVTPAVWSNNTKIDGQKTIQVNRSICVAAGYGEKYPLPLLGTIYNNKAYIIDFGKGEYTGSEKVEFDNLLSSFKFINSIPKESSITKNDVTNQPAYLKSVYIKDGKNYIDVDYIQMFATSEERVKAMIEDKVCFNTKDCYDYPNGYKRNVNPLIRTFEVSKNALINVYGVFNQSLNNGDLNSENSVISFNQLLNFTSKDLVKEHFIKIDVKDGKVLKLVEPYQE